MNWVVFMACALTFSARAEFPFWVTRARQLIGESKAIRAQALADLKDVFPDFEAIKPQLEGPYFHNALDVVVALNLPKSVDQLLGRLDQDADGGIALAINAMVNNENHEKIASRYIQFLQNQSWSTPTSVTMAMVDFFTHLRRPLPQDLFSALLARARLDVQQAAVLHFFTLASKERWMTAEVKTQFPNLLAPARAQALFAFSELKDRAMVARICKEDSDPVVQSACQGLPAPKAGHGG